MGWLILLTMFGVIGYFIFRAWRVWQERFANRHEFDAEHFALLMAQREEIEQIPATPGLAYPPRPTKPNRPVHASAGEHPRAHPQASPAPRTPSGHRQPLLDSAAQEVFQFLRVGLPSTPTLAGVDVAKLLDPHSPPPPRVQADFVLCKKDFTPAVVIFIERTPGNTELDHVEALLRQHRLRVLRWRADALPNHEQMRLQIFKPKAS